VHLANLLTSGNAEQQKYSIDFVKAGRATTLETFWKSKALVKLLDNNPDIKIFLDSGAHSLLNAQAGLIGSGDTVKTEKRTNVSGNMEYSPQDFYDKLTVNQRSYYSGKQKGAEQAFTDYSFNQNEDVRKYLDDYCEFIHKYKDQLLGYVNLDIIYNAEQSYVNQQYMESKGLRPIPVFHYGEDLCWLEKYLKEYDYIGIGGVAGGVTLQQFVNTLGDKAFELVEKINPHIKIHGFAVTPLNLMKRYSWYSCDSTTWLKHAAYGNVIVPRYDALKQAFDFSRTPVVISVSDRSLIKESKSPHYTLCSSEIELKRIEQYFESIGINSELLKTDAFERNKVNMCYYEELLKCDWIHKRSAFKTNNKSFF